MNINRDYLIINDVKKSNVKLDNGSIFFYITDKNTQNIFVNLVINVSKNDLIQKYANIENAEDYTLTMNIVKPDNTYKIIEGKLHDKEKAIFEFNLNEDCCDEIGTYRCELLTKCNINGHEEITTSNKLTYKVKSSVLNDLDDIVEAPEYPLVIQLFDKLSDINQYEEDRRTNELARQLAEQQRQTRFDELNADIDNKMVDVENRISAKEQAVDKLIVDTKADIDEYKVAKDQEIDEYKALKDTEINNAITTQDNKINEFINERNGRLDAIEAKDTEQDNRLDVAENRLANIGNDITNTMQPIIDGHTSRLDAIEAIDVTQNNRLDAIEAKNQQQDDRLLDIEKVNGRQDIDIKCLYGATQTIDVTKEGNSIYLQNSNNGFTIVDEIKGNTLVNCNKEPDKELILNGNINTSGDNNVTITEGVDGGLVDVALEGNTLVNVSKTKDITALPLEEELTYLYANTQYTVQFVSDTAVTVDITLGGTPLLAQSIVQGLNRITITTPSELVDNKLIIDGVGANISDVVVTDTDKEFGYFEGMKSVGECEGKIYIVSNNGNLFEGELISGRYTVSEGIWFKDNSTVCTKEKVKVKPNTRYKIILPENVSVYNISEYSGDVFIKNINRPPFTTSPNTTHINISLRTTDINTRICLVEYDSTINIDTVQSNTQQLTHEPLRAVGDAKDRYVLIDGKWYIERNTYQTKFNTTNFMIMGISDSNFHNGYQGVYAKVKNIPKTINTRELGCVICDKLPNNITTYQNTMPNDIEGVNAWSDDSADIIARVKTNISEFNQAQILAYIEALNLNIIYATATPTYEEIDYNPLETYADITHITTNSTIPTNITVKNHGFNCLLKPSTTYTISSNLGLNTVTTPSTLTEDCLRFMDTDTSDVTTMRDVLVLEGDWTTKADVIPSNFSGIESCFEQEYDAENGKYKVNVKVANEDKSKENNITFYINEPLRGVGDSKDRIFIKDDKVVVQRNCGIRPYGDGDFGTYPTDKIDTVYPLAEPTYEEIEYNDTKLFIESFKNSTLSYNSNVPVTSKLYYSYSVPIVDKVAQTANVTDQQDSMIIDLATQCAVMEMMLM